MPRKRSVVGGRHHHLRAVAFLQELRAAGVIQMGMADDDVLDVGRVEADRRQSVHDLVLDRVIEDRVDEDDAVRRRHRPGRVFGHAEEVQVVEDLHRVGVPRLAGRYGPRPAPPGRPGGRDLLRLGADAIEQSDMVGPGGQLRRRDVSLDFGRRLGRDDTGHQRHRHRQGNDETCHGTSPWSSRPAGPPVPALHRFLRRRLPGRPRKLRYAGEAPARVVRHDTPQRLSTPASRSLGTNTVKALEMSGSAVRLAATPGRQRVDATGASAVLVGVRAGQFLQVVRANQIPPAAAASASAAAAQTIDRARR